MNKGFRFFLLIAIATIVGVLTTCSQQTPTSISDRINMFITSLNGDRTNTWQNLGSSVPNPSAFDANYWNTQFAPADEPFSFSGTNGTSNPSDVEGNITGTNYPSLLHKFVMENDGSGTDNWKIQSIQHQTGSGFTDYPGL